MQAGTLNDDFFLLFQESGLVALLQVNNLKGFWNTVRKAQNLERKLVTL